MSSKNWIRIGQQDIKLTSEAKKILEFKGLKVVLLAPIGEDSGRNIAAFDEQGNYIWTVESISKENNRSTIWNEGCHFYNIWGEALLYGETGIGFTCTIDHLTGRITSKVFVK